MMARNYPKTISIVLVLIIIGLLTSGTMSHALGVHHLFAEMDHDGHEHSEFDLCQWVQANTSSSLIGQDPIPLASPYRWEVLDFPPSPIFSSQPLILRGSRGPPFFGRP